MQNQSKTPEQSLNYYLYFQYVALITLAKKEIFRIIRIWKMTVMPPVINTSLFCLIFGKILGTKIGVVNQIPYLQFIAPGLIMNIVVIESFNNVATSVLIDKYHHSIDDLIASPSSPAVILFGYLAGGVFRAILAGTVSCLLIFNFAKVPVPHLFIFLYSFIITSFTFSILGLINGLYASKFDELSTIPTFVLTPLTFFAGVFYDIRALPSPWSDISELNPIVYMVDTFRYGAIGLSNHEIVFSLLVITFLTILLGLLSYLLIRKGFGLKK